MYRIEKPEMHVFWSEKHACFIVFHIESGFFFKINFLQEAILMDCEGKSSLEVVKGLKGLYRRKDILRSIDELAEVGLVDEGVLKLIPSAEPVNAFEAERLHIMLHVSHVCNLDCPYCFAHGGHYGRRPDLMCDKVGHRAIEWAIKRAQPMGHLQIDFFGGEPLLNFELIKILVFEARDYARKLSVDLSFGIVTNGTLLTDEINQFLIEEGFGVMVSVDGSEVDQNRMRKFKNGKDSYEVVAENVRQLVDLAPDQVRLHATMTSCNLEPKDIVHHLETLGTDQVEIAHVVSHPALPHALREEHLPVLKKNLRDQMYSELEAICAGSEEKMSSDEPIRQLLARRQTCHGCEGGKTYLAIDIEGDIYFCPNLADRKEYQMGNVFDGLDTEKQNALMQRSDVRNRPVCQSCWARNLCGGSCIYEAQVINGNPIEPNFVACEQIKYRYELGMEICLEVEQSDASIFETRYKMAIG